MTYMPPVRSAAEQRAAVERLRKERAAKVAAVQAEGRKQRDAWTERSAQEREIDIEEKLTKDAVSVEMRRQGIAFTKHLGVDLKPEDRAFVAMDFNEKNALDANRPDIVRMRTWLLETARAHGIDIRESRMPQAQNGSAVRKLRLVDTPPIQSDQTAATCAHEIGHCLCDAEPADAPSKPGELGGRICVSAEVLAWRWVLTHTPVWTKQMHASMAEAIESYRKHATATEASDIDVLISQRAYAETKLRAAAG